MEDFERSVRLTQWHYYHVEKDRILEDSDYGESSAVVLWNESLHRQDFPQEGLHLGR